MDPHPEREPQATTPLGSEEPYPPAKDRTVHLRRVDHGGVPEKGIEVDILSRWCTACQVYRPPRCSHCRSCDNCVDGLDHHCVFLNTCIGRRNYTTFYGMLCHMLGLCFVGLVGCILHLYYLAVPRDPNAKRGFVHALQTSPASVAFFWIALIWMIPVACLWTYHTWLLCQNRSTVEQIRLEAMDQLYDMPRSATDCFETNVCLRQMTRCNAAVRSWFVPADFVTQPAEAAKKEREAQRRRTPFQFANPLRNAFVVLGRPTPAPYLRWSQRAAS